MPMVREFLVSLGAKVDMNSFRQFENALNKTTQTLNKFSKEAENHAKSGMKLFSAIGKAVGAYVALGIAVTKASISLDNTSKKYEEMARKQKKSTEEIRAQETALKVLGKTLNEVKADVKLKAQYDSLVALGKQLALPEAQGGLLTLRKIIDSVKELRVIGTYALQWINYHMLNRLKAPLEEIYKGLEKLKTNLKNNLPTWSMRIGNFLGNIMRLITAGVKGVTDIINLIGKLPDGIKAIGAAIAGSFTISKMGTVGWVLAGLTAILMLLDDFYTYKRGGVSALGDLWQSFEDGTTNELIQEKLGGLLEAIQGFSDSVTESLSSINVAGALENAFTNGVDMLSGFLDFLLGNPDAATLSSQSGLLGIVTQFVTNLLTIVGNVLETVSFENLGEKTGGFITKIFRAIGAYFQKDESGNSRVGELLGSGLNVVKNALTGIMNYLLGLLAGMDMHRIGDSINRVITNVLSLIIEALSDGASFITREGGLGEKLVTFVKGLFSSLAVIISSINFSQIGEDIGSFVSSIFDQIGEFIEREAASAEESGTILGNLATFLGQIVSGIVSLISTALSNIELDDVMKFADSLWNAIKTAIGDLADRLTTDDPSKKIDTKGIGSGIGEAIGNAISLGIGFLSKFVADALEWITSEEGAQALYDIGVAIVEGIAAGLSSIVTIIGDKMGELLFGKEEWGQMKSDVATEGDIRSGSVSLQGKTPEEALKLFQTDKEAFNEEAKANEKWNSEVQRVNEAYGFKFLPYTDPAEGFIQANGLAIPTFWKERGWISDLVRNRQSAIESQNGLDFHKYSAGMYAFTTLYKQGLRGDELQEGINSVMQAAENAYTESAQKIEDSGSNAAKSVESSGNDLANALKNAADAVNNAVGDTENSHSGSGGSFGVGGRFTSRTRGVFGEDGTEYIIPITKPGRARSLIRQMFNEMGSSAGSILADFGVASGGVSDAIGGPGLPSFMQPAAMYPSAGGGTINSNSGNTVTAHTTINVWGSGDPLAAGRAAAKANENNIIRRVRGCFE